MAVKTVPNVVVEWSPTSVSWIDREYQSAADLSEVAALLPGRELLVAISRRTAFIRAYRVPNTARAEVGRILDVQIGTLFPIPADDVSYDFHVTDDVNGEGRLAVVVAMRSSDLHNLHEQARAAGLKIAKIVPAALGSALLAKQLNHPNGAVVQRTREGLTIDLIANGELRYSRITPMPASSIGIEAEVSRTFAAAVLPCCSTIAAGGLALPDADASTDRWSLEYLLGANIDIDIQTPAQRLALSQIESRRRIRLSLLIFLASLLVFTFVYLRWSDASALVAKSEAKWKQDLTKVRRIRDQESAKGATLASTKKKLDRGFNPAQGFGDAIIIASNATPNGVWLTGISMERGKAVSIRGTAKSSDLVAQYQQALIADPRFRDVTLVFATNSKIEDTPIYQFAISAFPVGNLPLIDPEDTKKKKTPPKVTK